MNYQERKIHSGLVGTLVFLSMLVLFFFHTRPAARTLSELKAQVSEVEQDIEKIAVSKTELTEQGELSEVERKELDHAIPENLEQDVLITDLNKIAKTADVSFNALTFNVLQNNTLPTVEISAGFQGTPQNIIRFLKIVEVNPRKLVVKDAGINRSESSGGLELMNLTVTLQAFYRK